MAARPHFIRWLEGQAQQLRAKCSLSPFARLDPFALAGKMDIPVYTPRDIPGLDAAVLHRVLADGAGEWDAATIPLPNGSHVIVMNPIPCRERQHASLMEELAHIFLKHKPSALRTINGMVLRVWKQAHETQAYWLGAAALVPQRVMKGAITRRMTVEQLAADCCVSKELIIMREKVLGLQLPRPVLVNVERL